MKFTKNRPSFHPFQANILFLYPLKLQKKPKKNPIDREYWPELGKS